MTLKTEEAIKIAEQIQEDILHNEEVSTLTILRQYYSLVTLLNKDAEIEWALNELNGYRLISKVPGYRKVLHPRDKRKFVAVIHSCGILQDRLQNNETYTYKCIKHPRIIVGTKKESIVEYPRSKIDIKPKNILYILFAIKNRIYIKTNHILLEIKFGKFEFDIFEETRKVVDMELGIGCCPKAFKTLTEAYSDLMKSESPLDFQQIALACRVVLKDFADAIYPASDKKIVGFDGKQHTLKDDDYINRIIACIQVNTSSESEKEFMEDYLRYLESYLVSLNKMANKGIHHENSREYANRCLIYTYLVLGDVIKLLEKHKN